MYDGVPSQICHICNEWEIEVSLDKALQAVSDFAATERLLRDMLMVLECLWDENDRLGSLHVEVSKDGHPRQWLIAYVQDDLKPRVEAAIGLASKACRDA
jgi:hypothetical protein